MRNKHKNGEAINDVVLDPQHDPLQLQLLGLYVVQNMGQGTVAQIQKYMREKMDCDVHENILEMALDGLRKRGFLSNNVGRDADGNRMDLFGIRSLKFQSPPEVAHVGAVLPMLLRDEAAEVLKAGLDAKEHLGEAKEKASRLGYENYVTVRAKFVTLDQLIGGTPSSPFLLRRLKASPYRVKGDDVKIDNYFERDPNDGALIISSDQIKGWIRTHAREVNLGDVSIYFSASAAKIYPKDGQLMQIAYPVVDQRGGKGLVNYEAVEAPTEFDIQFGFPTKGFMSAMEFRAFLLKIAADPIRGLSPARGGRCGKALLIGYEELGETRIVSKAVSAALRTIPEELRKQHAAFLEEVENSVQGDGKFRSKTGAAAEAE